VANGFKGGGEGCLEDSEPNGNSSLLKDESNGCNAGGELSKGGWSQKKDDADMNCDVGVISRDCMETIKEPRISFVAAKFDCILGLGLQEVSVGRAVPFWYNMVNHGLVNEPVLVCRLNRNVGGEVGGQIVFGGADRTAADGGSDLLGSYVEPSGTALVVASISSFGINHDRTALLYHLLVSSMGILVCLISTIFATESYEIKAVKEIEQALKRQLILSTVLMTVGIVGDAWVGLPSSFTSCNFGIQTVVKNRSYSYVSVLSFGLD